MSRILRRVFRTIDGGGAWTEITGNLQTLKPGALRAIAYATNDPAGALVVGSDRGVFIARGPHLLAVGLSLGSGLPVVPVYQVEDSTPDRVLLVGTLGRGAWTLPLGAGVDYAARGARRGRNSATDAGSSSSPSGRPARGRRGHLRTASRNNRGPRPSAGLPHGSRERRGFRGPRYGQKTSGVTKDAAKPLGVSGQRLVAQAEATGDGNALTVVMIDPATGARMLSRQQSLPAGVRPAISETLSGQFSATAVPSAGEAIVAWKFVDRPTRGVRPGADDSPLRTGPPPVAPAPASPAAAPPRRGAFRLNVLTGATNPADAGAIGPLVNKSFALPIDERVPAQPVTQFLSADGRHFLVSARTDDDRVFAKYTLTVFDRATRARVGEFRERRVPGPILRL